MEYPININKRPRLRNPALVVGWADAGLVGFNAVNYMVEQLGAKEFGDIEPPDYLSFPHCIIEAGVLKNLEYPGSIFFYWKNKKTGEDLIFFESEPPDTNQYEFANLVVDVAEYFNVQRIYTVGGIHADIPHTEEPRIFAVINNPVLRGFLRRNHVDRGPDYHGPTSMNGLILGIARHRNIDGISLWGTVPRYIADVPDLRTCAVLVETLADMLGLNIDLTEMLRDAEFATKEINDLVAYAREQNPELNEYLDKLEKHARSEARPEDNEKFIHEIEDFLKKQKKPRKDSSSDK